MDRRHDEPHRSGATTSPPVRPPAPPATSVVDRLLAVQQSAGNAAATELVTGVQREPVALAEQDTPLPSELTVEELTPEPAPGGPAHPLLKRGAKGPDVTELQAKLNLLGLTPALVVDGAFGPLTDAAVRAFQSDHGLVVDGIVGVNTWGALDALALADDAGAETATAEAEAAAPTDGGAPAAPTDTGVGTRDTGEGDPQAPARGSTHPVIRQGDTTPGPAVEELQHKLNTINFLLLPPLPITGVYDGATAAQVLAFRSVNQIADPTVGVFDVGPETWARIDALAPGSPVGRVEKEWGEVVGGRPAAMVSRYTYRIFGNPRKIQVEVRIGFSGETSFIPTLQQAVAMTWNRFAAERTDDAEPHEQVPIEFLMSAVSAAPDNSVALLTDPDPSKRRSDASRWFVDDTDRLSFLAAHEFGHMIGLEDEYLRSHHDFQRVVGEPPSGTPLLAAPVAAAQLHHALHLPPDATPIPIIGPIVDLFRTPEENRAAEVNRVVANWNLASNRRAAFDVAVAYDAMFGPGIGGPDLVTALLAQLPATAHKGALDVFTFTAKNVMGVPDSMTADRDGSLHDHPVNPRHVRLFVQFVQDFVGGAWQAVQVS